ncbi:TIM barrel protein [Sphingomonas sp. 3P27F8]|uniref:sugar phosphate isomerase/epimerase family protein n=1 Tax=Sphingomonas sp. 3P27F8 TaxID=2502213 RepID=UPI0010F73609|nr:TIM barrel protein [Sphingomonas sp. 3P27F8]
MQLLSLAAGVLPEHMPQTTARAAAAAGYDATGVWVDLASWTDGTTRELKAVLADHALLALDVEVVWLMPGPPEDNHRRIVDIGREIGAANVLCVSSDPDDGATAAKLAALCEHAAGDIRISLEFALFTEVKSIAQASAILRAVGDPAIAMLIDPLHLARSGGTPSDVAALPAKWLPYAQFCDAGPLTFDTDDRTAIIEEAVDRRLLPGEGILPLRELASAMPPALPLSIELRSKALRDAYPDAEDRARAVLAATTRFFDTN